MRFLACIIGLLSACLLVRADDYAITTTETMSYTNIGGWEYLLNADGAATPFRAYSHSDNLSYWDGQEYYIQFPTNNAANTTTNLHISIGPLPAGTYSIWPAVFGARGATKVGVNTVGDDDAAAATWTGQAYWTNIGTITSSVTITSAVVQMYKITGAGTNENYFFKGLAVMTNGYSWAVTNKLAAAGDPPEWFLYSDVPISTNDAVSGNLLYNSSFELGHIGWTSGRNGDEGRETWLANMVTNDAGGAYDGEHYALIREGDYYNCARYSILARIPVRGTAGQRNYNVQFMHKKLHTTAPSVTWIVRPIYYGDTSRVTNAAVQRTFTAGNDWTLEKTNFWFNAQPVRAFEVYIQNATADPVAIDAVFVEESSTTNTFSTADPIEVGLTVGKNGNLLDTNSTRNVTIQLYNTGAGASNVVFRYRVHDWMNRTVESGSTNIAAASGYSTENLALSTTNNGTSHMYGWLDGQPNHRAELVFSVVPLPDSPSLETNSMFGIHGAQDRQLVASNFAWGLSWQRAFSPGLVMRWSTIEASSNVFTWTDTDDQVNSLTNAAIIFANISRPADMPAWALTNGAPRINAWTNFLITAVNRYKDRIGYWEDINEPSDDSPWSTAAYHAYFLAVTVDAIKQADANAYFVALGGAAERTTTSWASDVYTAMAASYASQLAQIDAISIHNYPDDKNNSRLDTSGTLGTTWGLPVWNTEAGEWGLGDYRGDRVGGLRNVVRHYPAYASYQWRRYVWENPSLMARNWLYSFKVGMDRYFYYDGRLSSYSHNTEDTNPTWYNYSDDSLNAVGVAYLWSKYFCDLAEMVTPLANANTNIQAVGFLNGSGTQSIAVWCHTYETNYIATITNGSFAVFDLMGNLVTTNDTTAPVGRIPTYWVSDTLSSNQLADNFTSASIAGAANTTAPNVSIDLTAHGIPDGRQLPLQFSWTAVDDNENNEAEYRYEDASSRVTTRYRFPGLTDWSDWSGKPETTLSSVPIQTYIEIQAMDADGNTSESFYGPSFGTPAAARVTMATVTTPRRDTNIWVDAAAPSGGDGTFDRPLQTLEAARDFARTKPYRKTVMVKPGTYYLTNTLTLTSADSNTRWISQVKGGAQITGTQPLTNWAVYSGSIYSNNYASQLPGTLYPNFRQMWWNGQRMRPARYPNYVAGHTTNGWAFVDPLTDITISNFWYRSEDTLTWDASATNSDVVVYPYRGYWPYTRAIELVDTAATDIVIADLPSTFLIRPNDRYFISHKFDQLDEAGEFFQQAKAAYFWPPSSDPNTTPPYVPVINCLVRHTNTANVTWNGFEFWGSMSYGIEAISATNCTWSASTIRGVGAQGVAGLIIGGQSNLVSGCDFNDIGAIGIDVRGGTQTNLTHSFNRVENCYFSNMLASGESAAVFLNTGSVGAIITNNTMVDCFRSGIRGEGNNHLVANNLIVDSMLESDDGGAIYLYNDDWLGGRGTVISNNWVSGCRGFGFWEDTTDYGLPARAAGIYLDGFSSGVTVVNNIVEDASASGIWMLWGSWNTVSNNLVYATGHDTDPNGTPDYGQIYLSGMLANNATWLGYTNEWESNYQTFDGYPEWATQVGWDASPLDYPYGSSYTVRSNVVTKNLIVTTNISWQPFMLRVNNWLSESNHVDFNSYWNDGATVVPANLQTVETDWPTWTAGGVDGNSGTNDVLLDTDSWQVAAESPALTVGYVNISTNNIGVYQHANRASWPAGQ